MHFQEKMESYRCSPGWEQEEIAAASQACWWSPRRPRPGGDTTHVGGDGLRGQALGHLIIPRWPFSPSKEQGISPGCSGEPAKEGSWPFAHTRPRPSSARGITPGAVSSAGARCRWRAHHQKCKVLQKAPCRAIPPATGVILDNARAADQHRSVLTPVHLHSTETLMYFIVKSRVQ